MAETDINTEILQDVISISELEKKVNPPSIFRVYNFKNILPEYNSLYKKTVKLEPVILPPTTLIKYKKNHIENKYKLREGSKKDQKIDPSLKHVLESKNDDPEIIAFYENMKAFKFTPQVEQYFQKSDDKLPENYIDLITTIRDRVRKELMDFNRENFSQQFNQTNNITKDNLPSNLLRKNPSSSSISKLRTAKEKHDKQIFWKTVKLFNPARATVRNFFGWKKVLHVDPRIRISRSPLSYSHNLRNKQMRLKAEMMKKNKVKLDYIQSANELIQKIFEQYKFTPFPIDDPKDNNNPIILDNIWERRSEMKNKLRDLSSKFLQMVETIYSIYFNKEKDYKQVALNLVKNFIENNKETPFFEYFSYDIKKLLEFGPEIQELEKITNQKNVDLINQAEKINNWLYPQNND